CAVRDVWWHVAYWCEQAARVMDDLRERHRDEVDPTDASVDAVNAAELERSRSMSLDDVRAALADARRHQLEAFAAMQTLSPAAEEWFEESGALHYAEHAADLERWAERVR